MKKIKKVLLTVLIIAMVAVIGLACWSTVAFAKENNDGATQTYNVTFNAMGGKVKLNASDEGKETLLINASVIDASPIVEKEGKVFAGWYANESLVGDKVVFPYYPNGAITLYASYVNATSETKYISTAEEFFDIRYDYDGVSNSHNYLLTSDIDLGGQVWRPFGFIDTIDAKDKQQRYDLPFVGTFDGNGHKVTNFKIVLDSDSEGLDSNFLCKGLFTSVDEDGVIKNLTVSNFKIEIDGAISKFFVGGIVGKVKAGRIANCKVIGEISNPKGNYEETIWDDFFGSYEKPTSNTYIGGLVGLVGASTADRDDETAETTDRVSYITNCSTDVKIISESVADNVYVGGLIGFNRTAEVTNCNSISEIKARYGGGLIGYNDNTVTNCYAISTVEGNLAYPAIAGGLIAYNDENGEISRSYSVGSVSARTAGGLVGVNMFNYATASNGINNCFSACSVTAAEYGGGLLGRTEAIVPINGVVDYANGIYYRSNGIRTSLYYINHCMAFGDVKVSVKDVYYTSTTLTNGVYHSVFAGGLIGHASEPLVSSCIAFGDVFAISERPISQTDSMVYNAVYANNLIGHSTNQYLAGGGTNTEKNSYKNAFAIEKQKVVRNNEENYSDFNSVPTISYSNANSASFLTSADGLGFDANIWNFAMLDIENGMYPSLR